MRPVGSSTNGDYDLSSLVKVHDVTPNTNDGFEGRARIVLGDGVKDLDGSGGDFEIEIHIDGDVHGGGETRTLGTKTPAIIESASFWIPANANVEVWILSPNAGDTDVDVTTQLLDSTSVQPTTASLGHS